MSAWRATLVTRCGATREMAVADDTGRPPRYVRVALASKITYAPLREPRTEEELAQQVIGPAIEERVFELYRVTDPFRLAAEYRERA